MKPEESDILLNFKEHIISAYEFVYEFPTQIDVKEDISISSEDFSFPSNEDWLTSLNFEIISSLPDEKGIYDHEIHFSDHWDLQSFESGYQSPQYPQLKFEYDDIDIFKDIDL